MNQLKKFLLPFLLLFSVVAFAQNLSNYWTADGGKIHWGHFSGKPDPKANFAAYIYTNVYYQYDVAYYDRNIVKVRMKTTPLVSKRSWVKPNQKTAELLRHEQGHFNICRIFADDFRRKAEAATFSRANYHNEIKKMYIEFQRYYNAMDKKYDNQTNHGLHKGWQKSWNDWFRQQRY
ncbi:DUF922 domain-containing protein [Cruoricaptor ignavus]|uniref:DUF922 domain-containing protein n=1 Tax=Cruoricaptor ignavus TaxID=1118202 RepID=UPI00370D47E6